VLTGYHHVPRVVRTRVFICREQTADVPAHPRILLASRDDTPRHAILLRLHKSYSGPPYMPLPHLLAVLALCYQVVSALLRQCVTSHGTVLR